MAYKTINGKLVKYKTKHHIKMTTTYGSTNQSFDQLRHKSVATTMRKREQAIKEGTHTVGGQRHQPLSFSGQ